MLQGLGCCWLILSSSSYINAVVLLQTALEYLKLAVGHFKAALSSFQKKPSGSAAREPTVLDQRALTKFIARCDLQAEVYEVENYYLLTLACKSFALAVIHNQYPLLYSSLTCICMRCWPYFLV